jgi:hypothetical protein
MAFETCKVHCTDTDKTLTADILKRSDRRLEVSLQGTTTKLIMSRTELKRPYVGNMSGMEFTTRG